VVRGIKVESTPNLHFKALSGHIPKKDAFLAHNLLSELQMGSTHGKPSK